MKTRIIAIGKSRGIRIPKLLLDQSGLSGTVEIIAENDTLMIRPIKSTRAGWDIAFQQMALQGDDQLLDEPAASSTNWDESEWEW